MGRTHKSRTEAGLQLLMFTQTRGNRVEGASVLLSRTMSVPVNPLHHPGFLWYALHSHPTVINLDSA